MQGIFQFPSLDFLRQYRIPRLRASDSPPTCSSAPRDLGCLRRHLEVFATRCMHCRHFHSRTTYCYRLHRGRKGPRRMSDGGDRRSPSTSPRRRGRASPSRAACRPGQIRTWDPGIPGKFDARAQLSLISRSCVWCWVRPNPSLLTTGAYLNQLKISENVRVY